MENINDDEDHNKYIKRVGIIRPIESLFGIDCIFTAPAVRDTN